MTRELLQIEQATHSLGLRLREEDIDALGRWTDERWHALGLSGMAPYCQLLGQDSVQGRRERELLTVRCTTGESYFFRDHGQFDLLATELLPTLLARRSERRTLRLWSAGCANGEEAYSLAMLMDEMTPSLDGWQVLVVGTDINSEAIERARRGVYRDWSFRTLDAQRKQRHFIRVGDQWQISQRLREMVSFAQHDLLHDPIPDAAAGLHDFDLILCRNVFIYLGTEAIGCISAKLSRALADDGYLLTGHNELFGHDTAPLQAQMFAQSAVYQRATPESHESDPGAVLAPPAAAELQARPATPEPARTPAAPAEPDAEDLMRSAWRHADGGHSEAAQQDCQQAIGLDRLNPQPYFLLAQLAQESGDASQAKSLLSKVIYLDPTFIAAYLELGGLHAQALEASRAERMYRAARAALHKVPAHSVVAPYLKSTAAEVLAYVERLLAEPAATAERVAGSKMSATRRS